MIATIVIAILTCIGLITCVLIKPEIKLKGLNFPLYPLIAVLGAILVLIFSPLTIEDSLNGFVEGGSINPLKILTLFISITTISVFLDEASFFEFLASKVLKCAGKSSLKLFIILYFTISILTVFTSNDIIILTFTPFIIYFSKNAKINPMPFLIAEFCAANTWSMMLMIGNPTNVFLASASNIDFLSYLKIMFIPTLLTGLGSFLTLLMLFKKDLNQKISISNVETKQIKDRPLCFIGLITLIICTISLAISGYIHVEMWVECLICVIILIIISLLICLFRHKKPIILEHSLLRVPYQLIPFILGMFVIVLALNKVNVTSHIAELLSSNQLFSYGITSFISSNLVNNIPMSVLFSSVINTSNASLEAIYATIIGSNLGALLTPVGALAGIMFSSLTKANGIHFSNFTFIKYGSIISLVSLSIALISLYFVL